jgi:hypothetical protein
MERKEGKYSATAKFAGLAMQWLVMLGLAVWGGLWLDEHVLHVKALLVIVLPLLALSVSLWQLIRTLNNRKK